jgi:hypothetical protein
MNVPTIVTVSATMPLVAAIIGDTQSSTEDLLAVLYVAAVGMLHLVCRTSRRRSRSDVLVRPAAARRAGAFIESPWPRGDLNQCGLPAHRGRAS